LAAPARQQQPGELLTQPVGPVTRGILGQAAARPSLCVAVPPGAAEHCDDLAVLAGAVQVLGQHGDVGVDVARKRGQLLPQELDADSRPRVRIVGGAAFCHEPGDFVQPGRPERVSEVGELDVRPARPVEPRPHQPGRQLLPVRRSGPAGTCVQGG
jgi:hypothetical protein